MRKIKNLHIIPHDKFEVEFIKFINNNYIQKEHFFLIISSNLKKEKELKAEKNVKYYDFKISNSNFYKLISLSLELVKYYYFLYYYTKKSEKIILHNVENRSLLFLYFFKNITKKVYFVIWGTEEKNKKMLINKIKRRVFFNIRGYITHIKGDYEILKKRYKSKADYYDSFMYPSNLYKELNIDIKRKNKGSILNIQVGNSAQNCNNHEEIFEVLKSHKNSNIKIFCILSYGDEGNKDNIIKAGQEIFGDKFVPITEFMTLNEYLEFLSDIDIAIFAHDRQKASGNIISLLSMGKTVYMKSKVTTYDMLKGLGVKVGKLEELESLELFSIEERKKNRKIIKERFSEKRLLEDLERIFYK